MEILDLKRVTENVLDMVNSRCEMHSPPKKICKLNVQISWKTINLQIQEA